MQKLTKPPQKIFPAIRTCFCQTSKTLKKPKGFWEEKSNILQFLKELKTKYNLISSNDWNLITRNHIQSNGGGTLLCKYSLSELKRMGCPEGNFEVNKPPGYWENSKNVQKFLNNLKQKFNLNTAEDWDSISRKDIQMNGGGSLLKKYSLFQLKSLGFPDGKLSFYKPKVSKGHWEDKNNVLKFLDNFKIHYNLNTAKDWNSITQMQIRSFGGIGLLHKYSMFDLKCLGFPEGKDTFDTEYKPSGYWENHQNIIQFLDKLKNIYNLRTFNDWNSLTAKLIKLNGGSTLLNKISLYELKCIGFPDGKSKFDKRIKYKPSGFWNDEKNVKEFLYKIKEIENFQTPEDWNSLSYKHIQSNGGYGLLNKYSLFELKCIAYPEGKLTFDKPLQYTTHKFWENKVNVKNFLETIKEKYNLHTPEDWSSLTYKQIQSTGVQGLLNKYSLFELKCIACPEGKEIFDKPVESKPSGYWNNYQNILRFLDEIKEIYSLNTQEDWNLITRNQIQSHGGGSLFKKYSIFDLKCLGCPEGKSLFVKPEKIKPPGYWDNEKNRNDFFEKLKLKYNLNTPQDWKRLSVDQIRLQGGSWLFYENNKYLLDTIQINFDDNDENTSNTISYSLRELIVSNYKRSSQRWLFLQVQKLFPNEEIVEDYFHSQISRDNGFPVQFDVFLIRRNIAIEYQGKQHYEDIPQGFATLEMHQIRDLEKKNLCKRYGIQLIIIPYWWDNKFESLKATLNPLICKE